MKWVSVEDRLPKPDEYNVVTTGHRYTKWEPYVTSMRYDGSRWINDADGERSDYIVTHWRPLPEPPK